MFSRIFRSFGVRAYVHECKMGCITYHRHAVYHTSILIYHSKERESVKQKGSFTQRKREKARNSQQKRMRGKSRQGKTSMNRGEHLVHVVGHTWCLTLLWGGERCTRRRLAPWNSGNPPPTWTSHRLHSISINPFLLDFFFLCSFTLWSMWQICCKKVYLS